MRWWLLATIALGGCDLVFALKEPNQPDEDQDGVSDAEDNCPTIANLDPSDADGDGVGDACDPDTERGTACPHKVAFFDPFDRDDLGDWSAMSGTWTVGDGKLSMALVTDDAFAVLSGHMFQDASLLVVGTLVELDMTEPNAPPRSHIVTYAALTLGAGVEGGYSCHAFHFHDGTDLVDQLTSFDPNETLLKRGSAIGRFRDGDQILLRHDAATGHDKACSMKRPPPDPASVTVTAANTAFSQGLVGLGGKFAVVEFDSVVVVEQTGPCQ